MAEADPAGLALATMLGGHAMPAFALALAVVLVAASALWWGASRWVWPEKRAGDLPTAPPPRLLAVRLAIAFGVVTGAAMLFAELAEHLGAGPALGALDNAFSAAVRASVPSWALRAFAAITHGGDSATLTVVCIGVAALLVWRGRAWLAFAWVMAVGGNALLNVTLKSVFERVRPLHAEAIPNASGWSFPSGHTSGSVVALGMLAYVMLRTLPRRWHLPVVLVAAALAFSIGCSRVFLGAHYLSDVVAGFASGVAWLALCILSCEWARHHRSARVPRHAP